MCIRQAGDICRRPESGALPAGIHILDTVALVPEPRSVGAGPELPAAILALVLIRRRPDHCIAACPVNGPVVVVVGSAGIGIDVARIRNTVIVVVRVARVADPVIVGIGLAWIWDRRTVVAGISHTVAVRVSLIGVCGDAAVVAGITYAIAVAI